MVEKIDLTAGGRLNVHPFVSERKLLAVAEMVKGAKLGGYAGQRARTDLQETLSTSDGPFSFAHLVNLRNLPLYDETEDNYDAIVDDEVVPDFNPTRFYALRTSLGKGLENGKDNDGQRIAPRVAELDTYQYTFAYTQSDAAIAVEKRGFKVGISLERAVNDVFNLIQRFPGDMLAIGRKTEQYVVIRALTEGATAASQLDADTDFISGETVAANDAPTPAALRAAIRQIAKRRDSEGNKVPVPRSFSLVVPTGDAEIVEYNIALARGVFQIQDGSTLVRPVAGADNLGRISGVIESEFVADGHWYLVPNKGTTEIPTLLRVKLAGYTSPEVYVSNFNGTPVAGGASGNPFQAFSFDNDSVDLKHRQFVNSALFSEDALVWSDGSGA